MEPLVERHRIAERGSHKRDMTTLAEHKQYCEEARAKYLEDRDALSDALDWRVSLAQARRSIILFLRASDFLTDVAKALNETGSHGLALRHFLAPPISQDQFKLICPAWPKSSEKSGNKVAIVLAEEVAATFEERRSRRLSPWLDAKRNPTIAELLAAIGAVAPLIANQQVATARRTRISAMQEASVIALLEEHQWTKMQSSMVSTGGQLPAQHFMHKTRFASGPNEAQEVDVACGLGKTFVLALECKVTNDETNSVKRINDVLKKAAAWRSHWGAFVKPAALLQGVIKFGDVQRLLDANVEVFWAQHLDRFGNWLDQNAA